MIDEKKLIKAINVLEKDFKRDYIHFDGLIKLIEDQPKIGEWIPCSERLPEENQQVIYCDECGLVGFALYAGKNTFWDNCVEFDDVIAWQPLPEAYREQMD